MNKEIRNAIERTLQGLAYWIAYKNEISAINLKEADIVSEAATILSARLSNLSVKSEIDYSSLNSSLHRLFADLVIYSRANNKCQCIIEFKLGENTNGGYQKDVQKLQELKQLEPDIACLVIIAYRESCSVSVPRAFVTKDGKARRGIIVLSSQGRIKVRRVCKAYRSANAKKIKKVICLEVL